MESYNCTENVDEDTIDKLKKLNLRQFNEILKEVDQLVVIFSVLIVAGSILLNIDKFIFMYAGARMFYAGFSGIIWVLLRALSICLVKSAGWSEVHVKRINIVLFVVFGIGIIMINTLSSIQSLYLLEPTEIPIKIFKYDVLYWTVRDWIPIPFYFIVGIILAFIIYPPKTRLKI